MCTEMYEISMVSAFVGSLGDCIQRNFALCTFQLAWYSGGNTGYPVHECECVAILDAEYLQASATSQ